MGLEDMAGGDVPYFGRLIYKRILPPSTAAIGQYRTAAFRPSVTEVEWFAA